ncbi:MAG: 1-(5-phosphoribosyl)-5-[(5-phosphoribosylamino)methylideneamino]imidazole-4-carboxamide isomerase [Christensenellales bacterium]
MKIFPAIDILGKKVVRLTQGDYNLKKEYSDKPESIAAEFFEKGATHLHVVDLDGAKSGNADNFDVIKELKRADKFIEVGGGIRSFNVIEKYAAAGIDRVILGTIAVRNVDFVKEAVKEFNNLIAVGVDVKDKKVAISGWREITDIDGFDFCRRLYEECGVQSIIYTDISTDGMLKGTNVKAFAELSEIKGLKVTASGGVTTVSEIKELKETGVYGVILGKALYENKIDLSEALKEQD